MCARLPSLLEFMHQLTWQHESRTGRQERKTSIKDFVMDIWMERRTDGWLDRWIDGWTDRQMDRQMDGWTDQQTKKWLIVVFPRLKIRFDGWTD